MDGLGRKALGDTASLPATESTIGGGFVGQLPPIQTPFAVGIGYELTRVAGLFPGAMMPGPSATWLSHTSNTNEPNRVPEGNTKPYLGPIIAENQVIPQKIASIVNFSLEAWQDTGSYGEAAFASRLPVELERAVWNTESLYLLQATTGSTNAIEGGPVNASFDGILNVSGTLTREVATGENPLDTLSQAFNDVRVGPAFSWPDLMLVHPTTFNALRRIKDSEGRYVMNLLAGPLGLTADGSAPVCQPALEANVYSITPQGSSPFAGHLWGVPVALTTQVPLGTAVVTSVAAGGGMYWTRLAMLIMFNMWSGGEWENNLQSFRAEERIALSVQRPSAVNIVTGLPTS
ncbi:phage major capsid family protein [Candidatus Mycobacterium methanotrophicum]|uniref:Phage major capsid protein n=2 Tax=Candidatus Mycobacterium methanotrophicum TaxID=2943498 RepID=A0ABY4QN02_9MYCO|nr:phage major capsid protein [Candidatus Mycobacterium methanotrophicum]UQX11325.1 phage major capsid protein [Candidatus Mycobacterium methanotrophicum]